MKKNKRQSNKNLLLGVFGLTIICGISQAVITHITPYKPISKEQGNLVQLQEKVSPTSVVVALATSTEVISTSTIIVKKVPIITNKPEVELQIREIADRYNFKWTDYLVKLANCESSLNHKATNTKGNYPVDSYDRGLFQFNSYWQDKVSDECAYNTECATIKTMEMINNGSQGLWSCDKIIRNIARK